MTKSLYFALLFFPIFSIAQINMSFEHTYAVNPFVSNYGYGFVSAFNTHQALYYYTIGNSSSSTNIYDQNHNFYKAVDIPSNSIVLITDKLFNDDDLIEFLYTNLSSVILKNENGEILYTWSDRGAPELFKDNDGNYKLAVYNQQPGPSYTAYSDVYALDGTLSIAQQELYLDKAFKGFPNPVENKLTISKGKFLTEGAKLEIFLINGQKVLEKNVHAGEKEITVDISSFESGTYIYKINGESHKFIKR